MAVWNPVDVNILAAAGTVTRRNFGQAAVGHVGAVFAGGVLAKNYSSPAEVSADSELSAAAKTYANYFFTQDNHPSSVIIYTTVDEAGGGELAASLDAALAYIGTVEALERPYYWGQYNRTKADVVAFAAWVALQGDMICVAQSSDADIVAGTADNAFDTIRDLDNRATVMIYHSVDLEAEDVAYLAEIASVDLDTQSADYANRSLTGITSDGDLTEAESTIIQGEGGNLYLPMGGVNVLRPAKVADGTWLDQVIIEDWVSARITEAVTQLLINRSGQNSKIPYTDPGITMVDGAARGVLQQGVDLGEGPGAGHIATYSTAPPLRASIPAATVAARELTIPVTVQPTGNIQSFTFNISFVI
jgi:hypothetical protein